MMSRLLSFVRDEHGWASPEWAMIATILVLGAVTGIVMSKHADAAHDDDAPALVSAR